MLGLSRAITDRVVSRYSFGTEAISKSILGEQQVIADTFYDLKLIPKKIDLRDTAPPWLKS